MKEERNYQINLINYCYSPFVWHFLGLQLLIFFYILLPVRFSFLIINQHFLCDRTFLYLTKETASHGSSISSF